MIANRILLYKIIFFVILLYSGTYYAQETETRFKHGLGVAAGITTGYGLSYRYMPKKIGVQLAFAPYYDESISRYSIGATLLFTLLENEKTTLFLYQGNHYYYTSSKYYYGRSVNSYVNNGIGLGVEFLIAKRIGFNLMGGYGFYRNFSSLSFTGETGLFYKL